MAELIAAPRGIRRNRPPHALALARCPPHLARPPRPRACVRRCRSRAPCRPGRRRTSLRGRPASRRRPRAHGRDRRGSSAFGRNFAPLSAIHEASGWSCRASSARVAKSVSEGWCTSIAACVVTACDQTARTASIVPSRSPPGDGRDESGGESAPSAAVRTAIPAWYTSTSPPTQPVNVVARKTTTAAMAVGTPVGRPRRAMRTPANAAISTVVATPKAKCRPLHGARPRASARPRTRRS